MKKLISLLILFSLINNFQSQNKIDLAKTILNETLDTKKYNLTKQFDLDQMTGLEYHNTYKVDNFVYLNTDFKSEYPKEKPQNKSSVGYLTNNQNKILGYYINTKNFPESDQIFATLKNKFGAAKVITKANENWPYSTYYWENTKEGLDILLTMNKKESGFFTNVYFITSKLKMGNMASRETVLSNFKVANSQ